MTLNRIEVGSLVPIYAELKYHSGFYRIRPGKEAYICLNQRLLEGTEEVHLNVYQKLLDYHKAIPEDSPYRLFPMTRYFEELLPTEPPLKILPFRPVRRWQYNLFPRGDYRAIGKQFR